VRTRQIRNFVRARGVAAFRAMVLAFEEGQSGQTIADRLGVSRERVRQWRDMFGQTITLYQPYEEVERMLRRRGLTTQSSVLLSHER